MIRLDLSAGGEYVAHQEECLDHIVSDHFGGVQLKRLLGDYNQALAVQDPVSSREVHLIGAQAVVPADSGLPVIKTTCPDCHKLGDWGFYAGALFFKRYSADDYRLSEVGGWRSGPGSIDPPLSATRTYAKSPFEAEAGRELYFGGYDCSSVPSNNTAWIFRGSTEAVFAPDMASAAAVV